MQQLLIDIARTHPRHSYNVTKVPDPFAFQKGSALSSPDSLLRRLRAEAPDESASSKEPFLARACRILVIFRGAPFAPPVFWRAGFDFSFRFSTPLFHTFNCERSTVNSPRSLLRCRFIVGALAARKFARTADCIPLLSRHSPGVVNALAVSA